MSGPRALPEPARRWLDEGAHVTFGTVAEGGPHLSVMWATHDGDDVVLSTITARRKYRNIVANPNVSVLWCDPAQPLNYVEVRGVARTETGGAIEVIERLAQTYARRSYREVPGNVVRVTIRVSPAHIVFRFG